MDKIAEITEIRSQLVCGLDKFEQGSGEHEYYEMKLRVFDTLIASILRDAVPIQEELEFYSAAYFLNDIKNKGGSDKVMEAHVNELRSRVAKGPTTRLFS
jgi:hypothetical protein